jgi:WD40 repeat protein
MDMGYFLPGARALATVFDNVITIWSVEDGFDTTTFTTFEPAKAFAPPKIFGPTHTVIAGDAVVAANGLWNVNDPAMAKFRLLREGKPPEDLPWKASGSAYKLAASDDGTLVASQRFEDFDFDGALRIYRVGKTEPVHVIPGNEIDGDALVFHRDNKRFLYAAYDSVAAFEVGKPEKDIGRIALPDEHGSTRAIAYSPDGRHVLVSRELVADYNGYVQLWTLGAKTPEALCVDYTKCPIAPEGATALAFDRSGERFAVAVKKGAILLYNLKGDRLQAFTGADEDVTSISFSPDGKLMLTTSGHMTATLWSTRQANYLQRFMIPGMYGDGAATFDPDGRSIFVASNSAMAHLKIDPIVFASPGEAVRMTCERLSALGVQSFSSETVNTNLILKGVADNPCVDLGLMKQPATPKPAATPASPPAN